jgi:hypothetical protein
MGSMDDYEINHLPQDDFYNSPQPDSSPPAPDSPPLDGTKLPRGNLDEDSEIAREFDEIYSNFPFSGFGEPFLNPDIDSGPSQMPDIEMQDDRVEPRPEAVPSREITPDASAATQGQTNGQIPEIPEPELVYEAPEPAADVLASSSPHWFWRIVLLLTTYLHLHFHLPHRACILLLKVLRIIFIASHMIKADDRVPVTLTTTFNRLNLQDTFKIHPVCPDCRRVFPPGDAAPVWCTFCTALLFEGLDDISDLGITPPKTRAKKPKIQCPQRPLSSCLPAFLNRPGIEEVLDEWRSYESQPGKLNTVMDGRVWKTLPGHDGKPFFDNSPDRSEPDELRIGITLGFDGYVFNTSIYYSY